jgi:hypothetical protein
MLDRLAALSLVGTVLQFVDFGSKIISNGHHIYRSADGALSETIELEIITTDLAELNTRLRQSLRLAGMIGCLNKTEQTLEDLCNGCRSVSKELLMRLNGLKVRGNGGNRIASGEPSKVCGQKADMDNITRRLGCLKPNWSSIFGFFTASAPSEGSLTGLFSHAKRPGAACIRARRRMANTKSHIRENIIFCLFNSQNPSNTLIGALGNLWQCFLRTELLPQKISTCSPKHLLMRSTNENDYSESTRHDRYDNHRCNSTDKWT